MNPEIKAQWVEALRSGKYKQGVGRLRSTDDRFCCLGVLCDLHGPPEDSHDLYSYDGNTTLPPMSVLEWAGLPTEDKEQAPYIKVTYQNMKFSLPYLNDSYKLTFPQIADLIEAQL